MFSLKHDRPSFDRRPKSCTDSLAPEKLNAHGADAMQPASPFSQRQSFCFFPRRMGRKGWMPGGPPPYVLVSKSRLESLYNLPLSEAAREIGLCATTFKKACRKLGINKWPFERRAASSCAWSQDNVDCGVSQLAPAVPCSSGVLINEHSGANAFGTFWTPTMSTMQAHPAQHHFFNPYPDPATSVIQPHHQPSFRDSAQTAGPEFALPAHLAFTRISSQYSSASTVDGACGSPSAEAHFTESGALFSFASSHQDTRIGDPIMEEEEAVNTEDTQNIDPGMAAKDAANAAACADRDAKQNPVINALMDYLEGPGLVFDETIFEDTCN
jgi:hypothetical protein